MWWWKPWPLKNAFQHRSSRIVGQQQMKTPSTPGLIEDLHFFFFTAWGFWGKFLTHQRIVQLTGKQLASACWDGVARIYDLEKEEEPVELRGHTGSPMCFGSCCVGYTPENERLEHKNSKVWFKWFFPLQSRVIFSFRLFIFRGVQKRSKKQGWLWERLTIFCTCQYGIHSSRLVQILETASMLDCFWGFFYSSNGSGNLFVDWWLV